MAEKMYFKTFQDLYKHLRGKEAPIVAKEVKKKSKKKDKKDAVQTD